MANAVIWLAAAAQAATFSDLGARGYALLPQPQLVVAPSDALLLRADTCFSLVGEEASSSSAFLAEELVELGAPTCSGGGAHVGHRIVVTLHKQPGSVVVGSVRGTNKTSIEEQAYKIVTTQVDSNTLASNITGTDQGLFYGATTFLQLLQASGASHVWRLPVGHIEDWPDVPFRSIFWVSSCLLLRARMFSLACAFICVVLLPCRIATIIWTNSQRSKQP